MWHTNPYLVQKYNDSWHKYDFNLLYSNQYWHSALLADVLHRQSHVYSSSLNHWAGYLWMVQPGNESFRVIRESVQPVHWNESALSNIRHCSHGKPWKPFPTFAGVSRGFYCRPNPEDLFFSHHPCKNTQPNNTLLAESTSLHSQEEIDSKFTV